MEENLINKKRMSYFQIVVLVVSTFAFAYLVYQTAGLIEIVSAQTWEDVEPGEEWEVFGGFGGVDIDGVALKCCTSSCQDLPGLTCESQCGGECLPTRCEETTMCEKGCCFDNQEGLCGLESPKKTCEEDKGNWSSDNNCNVAECQKGCCLLGGEGLFVTETRCEWLSTNRGLQPEFLPNKRNELACLAEAYGQAEGACVLASGDCRFVTGSECSQTNGNFFANQLCSHPNLNSSCERQASTDCVVGRDEVYWFDSCGNRENIYDTNKDRSWNGGEVLSKEQSCGAGSGNINSGSCGNCNFPLGSRCRAIGGADEGNFICGDLNCPDAIGNAGVEEDRRNGESWCVYESYIGEGRDIPGSRHYKYYCYDGEVKVEPCADYRKGVCVESEEEDFSDAACRPNKAMLCASYNSKEENQNSDNLREECSSNPDCEIRSIDFGKNYAFDVCTPKYPIGLDMTSSAGGNVAKMVCDQVDFKCVKIMVKGWGGWDCETGCECDTMNFTNQMNDWCSAMGDCGVGVNMLGEVTEDGYDISGAPEFDSSQYEQYGEAVDGQFAEPGDAWEMLEAAYGWNFLGAEEFEPDDYTTGLGMGSMVVGIGGKVLAGAVAKAAATKASAVIIAKGGTEVAAAAAGSKAAAASSATFLGALGAAAAGAAIGAGVGLMIANSMGLTGEGALYMAGGGAVAGAGAALWIIGVIGPWGLIAGGGIMLTVGLMGIGKVRKRTITFNCDPWQAVRGGDDCEKCLDTGVGGCTKYRCSTFGQTCEFINAGTNNELCVDMNPNDVTPPIISEWDEFITNGYRYKDITDFGFSVFEESGECLTEFTPVVFGIKTDEPSQCKIDIMHKEGYENMANYFGESNLYDYEHMMVFNMPTVESLLAGMDDELSADEIANLRAIATDRLGQMDFFVRCVDKKGNVGIREYVISTCVKPGPDLTPPFVTFSNPDDGTYLAWNQTDEDFKIWTNEPATCKYKLNSDAEWGEMVDEFVCMNDFEDVEFRGWGCNTNLTGFVAGDNNVYVKCRDQPWFIGTANESQRNFREDSDVINLIRSAGELKIDSIEPAGDLESGTGITSLNLNVKTSGGAEDGRAFCSYSFSGYDNMLQMRNTFSTQHRQILSQMIGGDYDVYIDCWDIGGNVAQREGEFKLIVDTTPPGVIRAYKVDGNLKIATDENSVCVFKNEANVECRYAWGNGSAMSGTQIEHSTRWEGGSAYYIKCKDGWENKPDRCSIIVTAQNV